MGATTGDDGRVNAAVGWTLTAVVALVAVYSFLTGSLLWSGFLLLFVLAATAPALSTGDWSAMAHWPVLAVGAVAVAAWAVDLAPEITGSVAIAALAILGVVELDEFTRVELTRRFAVVFGIMTAMAIQTLWIIAQYYSDVWLDTDHLSTQTELQKDIVVVTAVGFAVGGLFFWYFSGVESDGSVDGSSESGGSVDNSLDSEGSVDRSAEDVRTR